MAEPKRDKLGRRIPEFDRSAVQKKNAIKLKEKHGENYFGRLGARGGARGSDGHFSRLAAEGRQDELHAISSKGGKATAAKSPEEAAAARKKAWETRRAAGARRRPKNKRKD